MSVTYSIKVTIDEEEERRREERRRKEVEEFIHRFRAFANPATIHAVDSVALLEFKRQAREYLSDRSLDEYYKSIIRRMEMNTRTAENRDYLVYEDSYRPLWYF